MPAVVTEQDDDRIILVWTLFQRVDDHANLRIDVRDGREVALHNLFPCGLATRTHHVHPILVMRPFPARRGKVIEVVCDMWRQLDRVEREHIEILLRNDPRRMWHAES
jgi:hypothetical protein